MASRRYLPAIFLLFIGSGCAALVYEIVWFQLLQMVIGSSAISLGILLGTFIGGMCLGGLFLPPRDAARDLALGARDAGRCVVARVLLRRQHRRRRARQPDRRLLSAARARRSR